MLYKYKLRRDTVTADDGRTRTVYGISAIGNDGKTLASVSDIFFDAKKARAFVAKCNRAKLSLIHLYDIIDDVLTEEYEL